MYLNFELSVLTAAFAISVSAIGPVIELPSNYDRTAPWKQLAGLGLTNLTETDCQRTCTTGGPPRVCLYTMVLEYYSTMSDACGQCSKGVQKDCFRSQCIPADGYERGVMSVNRMIPGPAIHICQRDLLVVNVINRMEGTGSTIHWHGVVQRYSQWMDGVPYLTQCPIGGGSFRYIIPMEEYGTFFYHSHTALHRANGHYGAFIVRRPRSEEVWSTDIYDFDLPEHTMVISDWMHYTAEMFYPGLPTLPPGITPSTLLINGVGRYLNGSDSDSSFKQSHPLATFHVKRNQRYRFRIINANSLICPVLIQIKDHNMTLIATDGEPIEPVIIDSLISYAGERFDIVIDTHLPKHNKKTAFWIHFRGLGVCEFSYKLDQYAVLSYDSENGDLGIIPKGRRPTIANPLRNITIVNHPNTTCGVSPNRLCISDLRSLGHERDVDIVTAVPDIRLFIPFAFHSYPDNEEFFREGNYERFMTLSRGNLRSATMNDISFEFPTTPSLLLRDTDGHEFCSPDNLPAKCNRDAIGPTAKPYCECSQFVTLKENSIVEMTLIDDITNITGVNHPIHLHGYNFYVIWMGQDLKKTVRYSDNEVKAILRSLPSSTLRASSSLPALKDTVSVPAKGFVTVRWRADNPGDWLMHCHFEWHAQIGMMMAFRVTGKVAPKPPGFPTCGNFDPLLRPDGD